MIIPFECNLCWVNYFGEIMCVYHYIIDIIIYIYIHIIKLYQPYLQLKIKILNVSIEYI